MHAAKKESNRILLPYSLTRKPATQPSAKPKPSPSAQTKSDVTKAAKDSKSSSLISYGSDSDEDGEDGAPLSFFSLDTDVKNNSSAKESSSAVRTQSSTDNFVGPALPPEASETDRSVARTVLIPPSHRIGSLHLPSPQKTNANVNSIDLGNTNNESSSESTGTRFPSSTGFAPDVNEDAPLMFQGGVSSQKIVGPSAGPSLTSDDNVMYTNMVRLNYSYDSETNHTFINVLSIIFTV